LQKMKQFKISTTEDYSVVSFKVLGMMFLDLSPKHWYEPGNYSISNASAESTSACQKVSSCIVITILICMCCMFYATKRIVILSLSQLSNSGSSYFSNPIFILEANASTVITVVPANFFFGGKSLSSVTRNSASPTNAVAITG